MARHQTISVGRRGLRRRELIWWITATAALAVAVIALVGPQTAPRNETVVVSGLRPTSVVVPRDLPLHTSRSRPAVLSIASIDVRTRLGVVGLQADHQVMVPPSTAYASWFNLGPTPGQVGSAVILGHVDSYVGPGVFFELRYLKVGARVNVTLANGVVARFAVTGVVEYPKGKFPDSTVYGSRGFSTLQLVTCGGVFNHQTGHYESNIVVFTRLVQVSPPIR